MHRPVIHALFLAFAVCVAVGLLLSPVPQSPGESPAPLPAGDIAGDNGLDSEETVIARDASGQFRIGARVNGEDAEFLVDTGADVVALTLAEAERLGLEIHPEDFRPILRTASGAGNGVRVRIDRLELGDEEFRDVDAVVIEGLAMNLLGQSLLRLLGAVELRGDRMIIAHR